MNLQLNCDFKWHAIAKKITFMALLYALLSTTSYGATTSPSLNAANIKSPPLIIQAENYSAMKGVMTTAAADTGGGLSVAWTDTKDWLSYAATPVKILASGSYKVTYRVASANGEASFLFRETNNGPVYDKVYIPRTGYWQRWINVSHVIKLDAGVHTFGITVITGGFNLNWFKIENVNELSSSSSRAVASSKSANSKASASSASTAKDTSVQIAGPVEINWDTPKVRENGKYLDITELGGYQIRYKLLSSPNFTYITIKDPWTNFYNFSWLEGNYIFQIAAFDKNGQSSDFVNILEK